MASDPRASRPRAHRLKRLRDEGLKPPVQAIDGGPLPDAVLDCGWGRLLFAQTFPTAQPLVEALRAEGPDRRDIAFYVRNPHVLLAQAPQELFLDPSHTYRLDLAIYRASRRQPRGFTVRRLTSEADARAVNEIYAKRKMVPVPVDFFWSRRDDRTITYFVAEDMATGDVIGTVTGVNHVRAFEDPECGSSLWCLAVDPQASQPGIGEALVRRLAEHFKTQGLAYMDLSVMHDNDQAIALYDKLGFRRVHFFGVKRKNPINEALFVGPTDAHDLNPYARIIVDEARRRGIHTEIIDAEGGLFRLNWGGRSVRCRESLSELTSAVALSICDDKRMTRRIVEAAGVRAPERIDADDPAAIKQALKRHGALVVKPARGVLGQGVAVGLKTMGEVRSPDHPDYAFFEAYERPGLANHEPQPTAERFIDLLFPLSAPVPGRTSPEPEI